MRMLLVIIFVFNITLAGCAEDEMGNFAAIVDEFAILAAKCKRHISLYGEWNSDCENMNVYSGEIVLRTRGIDNFYVKIVKDQRGLKIKSQLDRGAEDMEVACSLTVRC